MLLNHHTSSRYTQGKERREIVIVMQGYNQQPQGYQRPGSTASFATQQAPPPPPYGGKYNSSCRANAARFFVAQIDTLSSTAGLPVRISGRE